MPLPLIPIMVGASIAAGTAQGAANSFALGKAKKKTKRRIDELLELKNGGRFGLTPTEQNTLESDLVNPTRRAAAQAQGRAEQLGAAGDVQSGRDLAQLRQERVESVGRAGAQASNTVRQASEVRSREQQAELNALQGLNDAQSRDQLNAILNPLVQGIGTAGALAGSPPGTFSNYGAFGSSLSRETVDEAARVAQENPQEVGAAVERIKAQRGADQLLQQQQPQQEAALTQQLGRPVYRMPDGTYVADLNGDGVLDPFDPREL